LQGAIKVDYILEHFDGWFFAIANVVLGIGYSKEAISSVAKEKRLTRTGVIALITGLALSTVGVLCLLGNIAQEWLIVTLFMVLGLRSILGGAGIIAVSSTVLVRKGFALTFGLLAILWAALSVLRILKLPPY
jgi:hypothetical protein